MFIIPLLASFSLLTASGSIIVIITALIAVSRWVFLPHLKEIVEESVEPLKSDIQSIKNTLDRELQPNGTPLATKVAVIEQKVKDDNEVIRLAKIVAERTGQ